MDFRFNEKFENHKVAIMSKSKILVVRLAGIVSLLRNSLKEDFDSTITKEDFLMATKMVKYSVDTSFKLLTRFDSVKKTKKNEPMRIKTPVPQPENFTIEYAQSHSKTVNKILANPLKSITEITKNKTYPQVDGASGADVAKRFLRGLEFLGLGCVTPNGKNFKRVSINDTEDNDEKESIKKKLKLFNVDC